MACDIDTFITKAKELQTERAENLCTQSTQHALIDTYGIFVFDELHETEHSIRDSLSGLLALRSPYVTLQDFSNGIKLDIEFINTEDTADFQLGVSIARQNIGFLPLSGGHLEYLREGQALKIDLNADTISMSYASSIQSCNLYTVGSPTYVDAIYNNMPLPLHSALCVLGADLILDDSVTFGA